jgi:hypothetical protein
LHIGLGNTFQQLGRRVYLLEALRQYQRAEQIGGTGPLARDKILEIQRLLSSQYNRTFAKPFQWKFEGFPDAG